MFFNIKRFYFSKIFQKNYLNLSWIVCLVLLGCEDPTVSFKQTKIPTEVAEKKPIIISLAPHITELLFAVGAGSQIVATVSYSDYPPQALEIPRIGNHAQMNYEAILAYQPDWVLAWESGSGRDSIQRLQELGLNVYSHEPKSLEDVADSLAVMGQLSGHPEKGQTQATLFRQQLQQLRKRYENQPSVSVYYQLWNEPQMTVNGSHLISDVIRLCGGTNIFADAIPLVPKISVESVIRRNPEVIIATGMSQARPAWLNDWQQWPEVTAVKHQQVTHLNPDIINRHSPRILQGAMAICEILASARLSPITPQEDKTQS